MAKLKKEKFDLGSGHKSERTTSSGEIEMYLNYDASYDFFYFEMKDLRQHINPELQQVNFRDCKTRSMAINIVKLLFDKSVKETKYLKIELGMPKKVYADKNEKFKDKRRDSEYLDTSSKMPQYLNEMMNYFTSDNGISISIKKIMKLELNELIRYAYCRDDWGYGKEYTSNKCDGIIEWSPELEVFLNGMASQMDLMCDKVLKFFMVEDVATLKLKLESNTKLLSL